MKAKKFPIFVVMKKVLTNIHTLYLITENPNIYFLRGKTMGEPFSIKNAWLVIENEKIANYGSMDNFVVEQVDEVIDCEQGIVVPGFVDSHTHTLFAGTRDHEMVMKLKGFSYEEITKQGGGIFSTVEKVRETAEVKLLEHGLQYLEKMARSGTTAVEIKSGYGLDFENEIKMLRVIQRLKPIVPQTLYATFLGAHAIPKKYKHHREIYIQELTQRMIPYIAAEGLADFVDVFCETGFFTASESCKILESAHQYGLKVKVHANELDLSGGVQVGVKWNAVSVDHLECLGAKEIELLQNSNTVATLLPTTAFYLRLNYAPARKLLENNAIVSLASDFNPGTSPSFNLYFVWILACLQMKMLPEEALTALTLNAAYALRDFQVGSLAKGKYANLILMKSINNLSKIPYFFGENFIHKVMIKGKWVC